MPMSADKWQRFNAQLDQAALAPVFDNDAYDLSWVSFKLGTLRMLIIDRDLIADQVETLGGKSGSGRHRAETESALTSTGSAADRARAPARDAAHTSLQAIPVARCIHARAGSQSAKTHRVAQAWPGTILPGRRDHDLAGRHASSLTDGAIEPAARLSLAWRIDRSTEPRSVGGK
ncbi:MAG: hypothetical protein U0987_05325 [Afipia sp.]|nr:hypothetical protein [Afipia sp.]